MGTRITLDGYPFEASEYNVEESSTPLSGIDSSGSTGLITFTIPLPNLNLEGTQDTGWKKIRDYGPEYFIDSAIDLVDSRKGYTLGNVVSVSSQEGSIQFSCSTRLNKLNVYNVQMGPYIGTLEGAFDTYCAKAGVDVDILVDPTIATRPVVYPGWTGELWYYLKQVAAAQDAEVSLVAGTILLRPIRQRLAAGGRDMTRTRDAGNGQLAQAVEVYQYSNTPVTNGLVYPPGGWTPEVEILTVNAGETITHTLRLSASVSSIVQPTAELFVDDTDASASVYTIIADDGIVVSPSLWAARGGRLRVTINPDTTSLTVTLTGAINVPTINGKASKTFSVALASDSSGSRYSTLRILGTGVSYNKTKVRVRTGVPASKTGTEVGATIDIPFISTIDDVYRVGTRAAKQYTGFVPSQSGSVISINRLGASGIDSAPSYEAVRLTLISELGGAPTYGQVQTFYTTTQGLVTYQDVQDYWLATIKNSFQNQAFGNVNGTRVYNARARRYFRIRTGTLTPSGIEYTADDDLTHGDVETHWSGQTYGQVAAELAGLTYKRAELVGMM